MIKWLVEKLAIEISLDVQDCESFAVMQFKALIEPDLTEILKREMAGLYRLRGGTIGESMRVNASELRKALNHGLPHYWPKLIEGEDIYKAHKPRPFPPGVKP
jgi:hypothetical protein